MTAILANWRLVAVAALVIALVGGGLYIRALRADVALAEMQADEARRIQRDTAAALDRYQQQVQAGQAALRALEIARQEAETDADLLRRRIAAAPRTSACADSPAMRGMLDTIRAGTSGDHP